MHPIHLLPYLPTLALSASICYFPNGDTSTDVPCSPDLPVTQCCGTRDACLSNGLCALTATNTTGDGYARGTCTDRSWSSPLCPQQCQLNQDTPSAAHSLAYDFRASGVQVWQCGSEGYARDARFCCESEAESKRCCSTTTAVFTLKSASAGPSTGGAVTSSSLRMSSSKAGVASAAQTVASSVGASATAGSTVPTEEEKKRYKAIGIGAGVGGAFVGCVFVAVVVFCVRKRRKERRAAVGVNGSAVQDQNTYAVGVNQSASQDQNAYAVEERKTPVELSTTERVTELAPYPQPVWELPGHETRSPRI